MSVEKPDYSQQTSTLVLGNAVLHCIIVEWKSGFGTDIAYCPDSIELEYGLSRIWPQVRVNDQRILSKSDIQRLAISAVPMSERERYFLLGGDSASGVMCLSFEGDEDRLYSEQHTQSYQLRQPGFANIS